VKAVASLASRFPACFATLDDGTLLLADAVDVGITMHVGTGLVVPVVRAPARLGWHDLATTPMQRRLDVMHDAVRARDLAGAHVVIALHHDVGVTVAVPIVFPGQVRAVSLAGSRAEVRLGADGVPIAVSTVQLGLAYDHRGINGRGAVLLLQAIKSLLESPAELERLGTPDPDPPPDIHS
jgi:2-oxoglutarate dehydrogenase E2 component (dihydrolipoamide succinyltransferase)